MAMREALAFNPNALILGQGVTDHKAVFGTVTGLHKEFPGRVIETPLAEDSIAGIAIGAALNGAYPINTHIRSDFALLAFNQLINLAAKYRYMFGGLFEVPMMMRLMIGCSWGQGAQHSQSLQSLLAHIPGLVVLMPTTPQAVLHSYRHAVQHYRGPVVILEHRLLYELSFETAETNPLINPFGSRIERSGTDITIVATAIMVVEARRAAEHLAKHGIDVEIVDMHSISHPDADMIFTSVKKTGRLIVADTSWLAYGVAAEVARLMMERDPSVLKAPLKSLGMQPAPCPTGKTLQDLYYPDMHDIVDTVASVVKGRADHGIELPPKQPMTDLYKHFRGPF